MKSPFCRVRGVVWAGLVLAVAALSACNNASTSPPSKPMRYDHVRSVEVAAGDTRKTVEERYGGEAVVWRPEAGFAVLGMREGPLGVLNTTTANQNVLATPEVTAGGGKSAWGGGGKSAWGGGFSAWGGGSATTPTTFTENAAAWLQVKLTAGQNLAPKLGLGVKVAVIDTGIDLAHPAFAGKLAPSGEWKDFVDGDAHPQDERDPALNAANGGHGHGTGVAGVILQVAPNATILPLRVLDSDGAGDVTDVVAAIDWAVARGAKVINLSLGAVVNPSALQTVITYATSKGVFVVSSAGNTGDNKVTYPAASANVGSNSNKYMGIGVGSVDAADKKSAFSTFGSTLELVAPGENLLTLVPGAQVGYWNGTSFAAPIVSGALALGLGQPLLPSEYLELAQHIDATAFNTGGTVDPAFNGQLGFGRLNVQAFLKKALGL